MPNVSIIQINKVHLEVKNNCIKHKIQWKVVDKVYGNVISTMFKLCLPEMFWIIYRINDDNILYKKPEPII